MAKAPTEPPGTSGSQFFVVTADGTGLTPDYAVVGEVSAGSDTSTASPRSPWRTGRRACPSSSLGHGLRELMGRIAAVVLAAGEASRFGAPKQRLLLPAVLERLARAPVDEVVVVSGAYELEHRRASGRVRGLGARPGSVAPLRARRARRGRRGGGGSARGRSRSRPARGRARPRRVARAGRRGRGVLRRRARPSARPRPRDWSGIPDEGLRDRPVRLVPCDDLDPPGDIDRSEDLG